MDTSPDFPLSAPAPKGAVWTRLMGPALAIVSAASAMSLAAVTLPALALAFPEPGPDPNLVVSLYLLAITALLVPAGRAGDRFGARPVLSIGLALFAIGAVWAGSTSSLWGLIAARGVQGVGAAAMIGLPLALVRATVPKAQIGRWVGVMGAMSAIGTASGPALGGLVTDSFGWQAVYLVQIPAPLLALVATRMFIPAMPRPATRAGFDLPGAVLLALVLAGGVLWLSSLSAGPALWHLPALLGIAAGLALLIAHEARIPDALLPLARLRNPHLALSLTCNLFLSVIMMGILVVGPFFLTQGLSLAPREMGLCMAIGPVASTLSGVPAGALTERLGPRRAALWGARALCAATLAMASLPVLFGVPGFALAFAGLAMAYQLVQAALTTGVMAAAPPAEQGVTAGLFTLSRNIGFVLGAGGMTALFLGIRAQVAETYPMDSAAGAAMVASFVLATALALTALLLLHRMERPSPCMTSETT
ncbi:MFS transporter [Dinoroseobacter sp. S124A]|uniref:MFS transporter n=1 Tax=Dinoroseobacter sp. S124A TaxID=3415128 RepID=UPI003C7B3C64